MHEQKKKNVPSKWIPSIAHSFLKLQFKLENILYRYVFDIF